MKLVKIVEGGGIDAYTIVLTEKTAEGKGVKNERRPAGENGRGDI